jgi:hypothetical protein
MLKETFVARLEEKYGKWDKNVSKFGSKALGLIAKDLCISNSQLTKLLSGNATDGMYDRAIKNVNNLIKFEETNEAYQTIIGKTNDLETQLITFQQKTQVYKRNILIVTFLAICGITATLLIQRQIQEKSPIQKHPLANFFDSNFDADFDSPYLNEREVQNYCPCSAYEGEWSLSDSYKLPLPGNKQPGIYYLAKSADVRMKCSKSDTLNVGKGRVLLGYEYLTNEIWIDTKRTPLSPTYFNKTTKNYTDAFYELDFENNPQFQKVATIESFFIDKFKIYKDSIIRKGEPCGRFASDVNHELIKKYEIDVKHILEDVLGDLTKTDCETTTNNYCDPNLLTEGESTIEFDCVYTIKTENLGIGGGYPYMKGYRLEKQNYSNNLTCGCE